MPEMVTRKSALIAPEPQAVRRQLANILTSTEFNVPDRLRKFLVYVVEEALGGRADRIKAYSIATHVFGRPADFDLMNDPVVRIEAGRLRRALERYYLTGGVDDPIVIDIPKGGYAPEFKQRQESPELAPISDGAIQGPIPSQRSRTRVQKAAVAGAFLATGLLLSAAFIWPFVLRGHERPPESGQPEVNLIVSRLSNHSGPEGLFYASGISNELLYQLARFRELKVIVRPSDDVTAIERTKEVSSSSFSYFLEGSVRIVESQMRIYVRLLDGINSTVIWNKRFDRKPNEASEFQIESEVATAIATAVAQPYGAIFKPISLDASSRIPAGTEAHRCILLFYEYRREPKRKEHEAARSCLEQTVARNSDYSTGWAMLAYLYLDEDRFEFNRNPFAPTGRARAREVAERAVRLDPANVRGLQALMTVLFYSKEPEKALLIGEKAFSLNPNDTELLAEFGSRLAQAGDRTRGVALLQEAIERNPQQNSYYIAILAQNYFFLGRDKEALEWIRRTDLQKFSNFHFVAALIFARFGLEAETKASVREFLRMRPRFFENFEAEMAMRNYSSQDRDILRRGAKLSGFPVPEVGL